MYAGDYLGVEKRRGRFELRLPRAALSADCSEVRATSSVMSSGTEEEEGPATTATIKQGRRERVPKFRSGKVGKSWEERTCRRRAEQGRKKKERAVRQIHAAVCFPSRFHI